MTQDEKMLSYIDSIEDEMIAFWKELVYLESNSYCKEGVDAVGRTLAAFCQNKLGYHVRFVEDPVYGNCLAACSCPFEEYRHGIALSAHMDTVHKAGYFDPVISQDDTYLYGPGAGDCKGGIIMALTTALALNEIGYSERPVKLLFAADEEIGSPVGRRFYPVELHGCDYMFNAESGFRNKLVTGRKASLIAIYNISGVGAHIGYLTEKPKSAIREAAMKLLALEDASDYENLVFCGGVISGGNVATSVPSQCRLEVNVRIKDGSYIEEAVRILKDAANQTFVSGTTCELEIKGKLFPMCACEANEKLCEAFSNASVSLGFGGFTGSFVGGASDAAYASELGIPVICATGPVVDFQHTRSERVMTASMAQRAKIHVKTILSL